MPNPAPVHVQDENRRWQPNGVPRLQNPLPDPLRDGDGDHESNDAAYSGGEEGTLHTARP